jgi:hypothetical protein
MNRTPKRVEQETDHRPGIVAASRLTDQQIPPWRRFGEGQVAEINPAKHDATKDRLAEIQTEKRTSSL